MLDDQELHEERYFPLAKLADMSSLLNQVVYHYIWERGLLVQQSPACSACFSLLALLHQRDGRKTFCDPTTWEIKYAMLRYLHVHVHDI